MYLSIRTMAAPSPHTPAHPATRTSRAVILPPIPAMYANPQSVDDIIAHTVGKALDQFGIANELFKRWRSP